MCKNRKLRVLITSILSLAILLSNLMIPAKTAYASTSDKTLVKSAINDSFVKYKNRKNDASRSSHKLGYIPSPNKIPNIKPKNVAKAIPLPSSYDLRVLGKLTPVKDQSTSGSCWTFATYGSLESCLLPDESRDYSENSLKNRSGFDYDVNGGGNSSMATAYLARWEGPVSEEDDPYNPDSISSPEEPAQKHIQEVLMLPDRADSLDNELIKDAVMSHGAVYTSLYWDDYCYDSANHTYYDSSDDSYYEGNNHAVAIVGWDDNYSASKFDNDYGAVPDGNGAFIVRNSWGSQWGDNGYFYVSYYDQNIGVQNAVFDDAEPLTNYSDIYQYDPLGNTRNIGYYLSSTPQTGWFANVFTVSSDESLSAVSFYNAAPNSEYQIYVSNPYDGTSDLASSRNIRASGILEYAGYHTIKLNSVVPLTSGTRFAVIVKLTTPGYKYPIPVEMRIPGYSGNATASPGESYISDDGASWSDLTDHYEDANVCIKAFTSAAGMPVTGVSLDKTSASIKIGTSLNLTATVTPSDATNKSVTWSSNNTSAVTVDSTGKVTAVGNGVAAVTAKTVDGGYTAKCLVAAGSDSYIAVCNFVTRFYQLCLGRMPDESGLKYWVNGLVNKTFTGAGAANNFIFSKEFLSRNVTDSQYIDIMYKAFFDRAADSSGKAYWVAKLANGNSRLFVLSSFVNSAEFNTVCRTYGINRGSITLTKSQDLHPKITEFVYRLYVKCLGRKPDDSGLNYYVSQLASGKMSGTSAAYNFVFSAELTSRNLSNTDFTTALYRVFLNREPDAGGMAYHVNKLNSGSSRNIEFYDFASSSEFAKICSSYGIKVK